ncbi:MAG: hypothetical protein DI577_04805 [Microbacterium sp.]|nr:MAG: hypothetical protein DI577_04805 [Microbacterium sp.]PZU36571.1 MAG: hypothetical protein DI575_04805 [Microbacterium sp.]
MTDFEDVVAVAESPTPALPVELTDADGYDVSVTDVSRIVALDLYGTYTKTLEGLGLTDNIVGRTVSSTENAIADRPVVIDFVVSADAMVWPMVPQGVSNSYIQYARDHAPSFDEED